jgi:hypothetical protein
LTWSSRSFRPSFPLPAFRQGSNEANG